MNENKPANRVGQFLARKNIIFSGMGTCGLVGQIGVYTGWIREGDLTLS